MGKTERWNTVLWKVIRSYQDNKETFDQNVSKCWDSFFLIQAQTQYKRFHITSIGCCYSSSSQCHNFAESTHAGKQYEFVISRNSKFLQHWLIDYWINRILWKSSQCSSCYTSKVLSNYLRLGKFCSLTFSVAWRCTQPVMWQRVLVWVLVVPSNAAK